MTRTRAAASTALLAATCWALAWAAENYPTATIAGISLGTVYLKFREIPDDRSAR